jgi:hypothetical protein
LNEAYKNYFIKKSSETGPFGIAGIIPTKEEFIYDCKTDLEFSEKWGLKIEERELNLDERKSIYEKEYTDGVEVPNNNWLNSKLTTRNIPSKLITITYNNKIIEMFLP